jgi:hypothetical protein
MTIKKYSIASWYLLPYYAITLLVLVLTGLAIGYNYKSHLPWFAWVILGVCAAGFASLSFVATYGRWRYKKSILFYTSQGVAVMTDSTLRDKGPIIEALKLQQDNVDKAIGEVISFWSLYFNDLVTVKEFFNGASLIFTAKTIDFTGYYHGFFFRSAAGLTQDKTMLVLYRANLDYFLDLIKHEASHVCLNALGVKSDQHGVFDTADFPY